MNTEILSCKLHYIGKMSWLLLDCVPYLMQSHGKEDEENTFLVRLPADPKAKARFNFKPKAWDFLSEIL